ncbi:ribonuclease HI [Neolewinella xylanilytica]|uniref:Ribonuclease H n=1 Tax=Neolewinella xylanilytica TaxID=1514080 RepID=A0A2S6I336_9BACT|nr:ribonuclease H family protein [Neolewinella xylanilytica]PPK85587.1 ribonuclease HI [Neolewinella xylanilytica]
MAKKKYYVVWMGHRPGVYTDWESAKQQIEGYKGAKYKGFPDPAQAEAAFRKGFGSYLQKSIGTGTKKGSGSRGSSFPSTDKIVGKSISVDAACSGNPGRMEYQGVTTTSGQRLFHRAFPLGTNNIGEFLALVHALAFLQKQAQPDLPIYTDSKIAMGWIRKGKCKTTLARNAKTAELYDLIDRAEAWLKANTITNPVYKWKTEVWGEIPADFGRK